MDIVDKHTRSRMMSGIRCKNTKPELLIRSSLHKLGLRYRLHVSGLTGKPDLVFPQYRAVIFIHGCFWHGHSCHLFKLPTTRQDFWSNKINQNKTRDTLNQTNLHNLGWRVGIIWECAVRGSGKDISSICNRVTGWLKSDNKSLVETGSKL